MEDQGPHQDLLSEEPELPQDHPLEDQGPRLGLNLVVQVQRQVQLLVAQVRLQEHHLEELELHLEQLHQQQVRIIPT